MITACRIQQLVTLKAQWIRWKLSSALLSGSLEPVLRSHLWIRTPQLFHLGTQEVVVGHLERSLLLAQVSECDLKVSLCFIMKAITSHEPKFVFRIRRYVQCKFKSIYSAYLKLLVKSIFHTVRHDVIKKYKKLSNFIWCAMEPWATHGLVRRLPRAFGLGFLWAGCRSSVYCPIDCNVKTFNRHLPLGLVRELVLVSLILSDTNDGQQSSGSLIPKETAQWNGVWSMQVDIGRLWSMFEIKMYGKSKFKYTGFQAVSL